MSEEIVAGIKNGLSYAVLPATADLTTQVVKEYLKTGSLDVGFLTDTLNLYSTRRMFLFAIWSGFLMYFWFQILVKMFPRKDWPSIINMVIVDHLVFTSSLYIMFYGIFGIIDGVPSVTEEILTKFPPTYLSASVFWPLAQLFNFSVIPPNGQIRFLSLMSFIWQLYFCFTNT